MTLEEYWQRLWSVVSSRGRRSRRRGRRGSCRRGGRGRGGRLPRVSRAGGRVLTELRRHGQERRELAGLGRLAVLTGGGGQAHALTVVGLQKLERSSIHKYRLTQMQMNIEGKGCISLLEISQVRSVSTVSGLIPPLPLGPLGWVDGT